MSGRRDKIGSNAWRAANAMVAVALSVFALIVLLYAPKAEALPSYARQTGQQCAACHNGFPELTPYGRLFKLNGYTFGGGTSSAFHVAVMAYLSDTHTQAAQQGGAAPHFGPNNNLALDQASVFYGGEIAPNLGAFAQVTYDGIGRAFSWDNTDIRYARASSLFGDEAIFGVSLNNNPTVQDVWNTTPAWRFPFVASGLAPGPVASTMIEGGFAQQVTGLTTYAYWNRLVYLEVGGYSTLSPKLQRWVGVYSLGNSAINGVAPYWRAALQHDWSRNSLEAGVFGMAANVVPGRIGGFGTDHLTDVGVDSQYQFLSDINSFSVQASGIFEDQDLNSTFAQGGSSNLHNKLRSYNLKGTYFYDQTYGATLALSRTQGSADSLLYSGSALNGSFSPNSTALISEIDYIPFNHGGPSFWPWLNVKFGAQYTYYPEFDGVTGAAAADNNVFYVFGWLAL